MLEVYGFYKNLTPLYAEEYQRETGEEYNSMIKKEIDNALVDRLLGQLLRYGASETVRNFVKN